MTSLDMGIPELADLLRSQISGHQRRTRDDIALLEYSLGLKIRSFHSDLAMDVHMLRDESTRNVNSLRAALGSIQKYVSNSVERLKRQNNLIVTGVPYTRGENLMGYYHAWCNALGYTKCFIPPATLNRLRTRNNTRNGSTIVLSFALSPQRNEFFSRYLQTCTLSLANTGFSSTRRIYVNEDLAPRERKLRSKALRLKRNGEVHSVYTRHGIVYVKLSSTHQGIATTSGGILDHLSKSKLPFP